MVEPIIRKRDRVNDKMCIKCRNWHPKVTHFGKHDTSSDGRQSICKDCKGKANKNARANNVRATIRHHTATRCLTQLGDHAPSDLTKNLETYLGYRISKLVEHLRADLREREGEARSLKDALNEGYHIDHIYPLSRYTVLTCDEEGENVQIDWETFRKCWDISNLSAIPAQENLQKGAKVEEDKS